MTIHRTKFDYNIVKTDKGLYNIVSAEGKIINGKPYSSIELFNFERYEFHPQVDYPTDSEIDYLFAVMEPAKWKDVRSYYKIEFTNFILLIFDILTLLYFRIKISLKLVEKWKYIDEKGQSITKAVYDEPYAFINGLAYVTANKKWGIIDAKGFEIIPVLFDNVKFIWNFAETGEKSKPAYIQVRLENKFGIYSLTGEPLIPPIYKQVISVNWEAIEILQKNHSFGYGYLIDGSHSDVKSLPLKSMVGKVTHRHFFFSFSDVYTDYNFLFCESENGFEKIIFDRTGYHSEFDFISVSYRNGTIRLKNSHSYFDITSNGKYQTYPLF